MGKNCSFKIKVVEVYKMNQNNNSDLTKYAQDLRSNMTKEEKHLWYDFFKKIPYTVNRQKVIGVYILDFYCAEAKIAIELDGSQHYEPDGKAKDKERDAYLNNRGIKVIRYTNIEINRNFDGVCLDILKHLEERHHLKNNACVLDDEVEKDR